MLPAVIGGVVLVIVIVAVVLAGSGGGGGGTPTATATAKPTVTAPVAVTAPGMTFKVPGTWGDPEAPPDLPGFLNGAVAKGEPGLGGGAVMAGYADKTALNPTLLADDLRQTESGAKRETVKGAGGLERLSLLRPVRHR